MLFLVYNKRALRQVVVHAFSSCIQEAGAGKFLSFEVSPVYRASSRTLEPTQKNSVL